MKRFIYRNFLRSEPREVTMKKAIDYVNGDSMRFEKMAMLVTLLAFAAIVVTLYVVNG